MARRPAATPPAAVKASRPSTRESLRAFSNTSPGELFWDLVTFDKLLTGPIVHILYWAGLALILIAGCGILGGTIGMASREGGWAAWLLGVGAVISILVGLSAVALIWRSVCEFYVAVFRISDDLRAMRANLERTVIAAAEEKPRRGADAA
jgi:hypothetical protein